MAALCGTLTLATLSAGAQSATPLGTNTGLLPTPTPYFTTAHTTDPTKDIASILDLNQDPPRQAPPNPAPEKPRRVFDLGPNVGVYLPTSSKTQRQFGSAWWSYGVGVGLNRVKPGGSFRPDLHFLSQAADGNRFFLGLVGVEYRKPLLFGSRHRATRDKDGDGTEAKDKNGKPGDGNGGRPDRSDPPPETVPYLLPYFGFSADLAVGDLRDVSEGIHSGVRTGFSGTAFLGLNVGRGFYSEIRYREVTQFKGFDLSGLNLTVGYRFRLKLK